jgi:hypothetical protein
MSEQDRDRYLHDFHLAFRGNSDDWSVPESYYKEWLALERQKGQKDGIIAAGCDFSIDENGNIQIRQAANVIQISAQDRVAFSSALFRLPARGKHPLAPGAYPGQSSAPNMGGNHLEGDDRPLMKERMERNIQDMERWAMASAQRYPKHR